MAIEKKIVQIFIRPLIQTKGSVGGNCGSICVGFACVLGFPPVELRHRRNTGNGVCLYLVLTGICVFLYTRINPRTLKTFWHSKCQKLRCSLFPSSDKFSEIGSFSSHLFYQHCLMGLGSTKISWISKGRLKIQAENIWQINSISILCMV